MVLPQLEAPGGSSFGGTIFLKVMIVAAGHKLSIENIKKPERKPDYLLNKIILPHLHGIKFIRLVDVVYLEANNSYTALLLTTGEKITASKLISKFEEKLPPEWFHRIHKSYIINIFHLKEYLSKDGDFAVMTNGDKLYISRYRLNDFINALVHTKGWIKM